MRGTFLALLLFASAVRVQPEEVLTARALAAGFPGTTVYLALVLEIQEGWVIQAHTPTLAYLIPTVLVVEPVPGVQVGKVIYPEPVEKFFSFARARLAVYSGTVVFIVPLTIEADASPGLRVLRGRLQVQPCTDTYCLFPEEREIFLHLWVLAKVP
ncbi:MAG: protein-disulfide reductase DsbD N-terminal domain-containing protein [Candidatus Bipolaricaulota bacterium]|nr:protein-disulfide reductase DsbD N-terminal domain-containing protein [Candidatus Bipolaricaulota bacterium]MDW8127462.1 protein-disulfide reductase DsbD family protein [Candidatus Bipolaricaulota bacterium]